MQYNIYTYIWYPLIKSVYYDILCTYICKALIYAFVCCYIVVCVHTMGLMYSARCIIHVH